MRLNGRAKWDCVKIGLKWGGTREVGTDILWTNNNKRKYYKLLVWDNLILWEIELLDHSWRRHMRIILCEGSLVSSLVKLFSVCFLFSYKQTRLQIWAISSKYIWKRNQIFENSINLIIIFFSHHTQWRAISSKI